jgi:prepilin-type N-terminal cleavage/methylation domain-containing protein
VARRRITALHIVVRSSSGFTLVEVMVALGILTLIFTFFGSAVFQVLSTQRGWQDDVEAIRTLRHAGSLFAGDALNAETTSLTDPAAPVSSVTLNWNDSNNVAHTSTYSLSGDLLSRDYDGASRIAAEGVTSAGFSLSGKLVTFDLVVNAARGATKSRSLRTYLRNMN